MAETKRPEEMRPKGPSVRAVPEGDNRERLMCPDCGFVDYDNPKIVVGSVALWQERVLLCKRAINPRLGYWTLPAGYLELNETTSEGALREAREEARARLALDRGGRPLCLGRDPVERARLSLGPLGAPPCARGLGQRALPRAEQSAGRARQPALREGRTPQRLAWSTMIPAATIAAADTVEGGADINVMAATSGARRTGRPAWPTSRPGPG